MEVKVTSNMLLFLLPISASRLSLLEIIGLNLMTAFGAKAVIHLIVIYEQLVFQ